MSGQLPPVWNILKTPMKLVRDIIRASDLDAQDVAQLTRLEMEFDANPGNFISTSVHPKRSDFQLIGEFVQVYCFAEYSARHIIELIDSIALDTAAMPASRFADHDVFPQLKKAAERLNQRGKGNLKETLLRAAGTISMHRQTRHTLAHWVVRRVDKGKAYLLLSKSAQGGKKRHGKTIGVGEVNYGFIGTSTLRSELKKLGDHTNNLSFCAMKMDADRETLAKMLASN